MSEEFLDIYDDDFKHIGIEKRSVAHRMGYWHYTFHCWILLSTPEGYKVLFQKRHMNKDTNPGKLSVSAAGHILAGETYLDGLREVEEEVGLRLSPEDISFMGEYKLVMKNEAIYNKEVSLLYYTVQELPLSFFKPQTTEVSGLYLIPIEDFYHLLHGDVPTVEGAGYTLNENNEKIVNFHTFSLDDFAKGGIPYYRYVSSFLFYKMNLDKGL